MTMHPELQSATILDLNRGPIRQERLNFCDDPMDIKLLNIKRGIFEITRPGGDLHITDLAEQQNTSCPNSIGIFTTNTYMKLKKRAFRIFLSIITLDKPVIKVTTMLNGTPNSFTIDLHVGYGSYGTYLVDHPLQELTFDFDENLALLVGLCAQFNE